MISGIYKSYILILKNKWKVKDIIRLINKMSISQSNKVAGEFLSKYCNEKYNGTSGNKIHKREGSPRPRR